tara:strand:- start:959 stop:1177 length:219 start_codon:yes stop_codon:yes gene_type:complete
MPSQEQLFDFLHEISIELNNNGYPILNNIIHPFPKLKWEEEIIKEMMNERRYNSDSEYTDTSDDDKDDSKEK